MLFIGGSWWVTLISFTCFIQFHSRIMRNEKSRSPVGSSTLHLRQKIICAVQMSSHSFTCWVPCRLHCRAKVYHVFLPRRTNLRYKWWNRSRNMIWTATSYIRKLDLSVRLPGCLHGVALRVSLMQTQCPRLPWWGCLGAYFGDTPSPRHSCRLSRIFPGLASWLSGELALRSSDTSGNQVLVSNIYRDTMVHSLTQKLPII